MWCYQKPGFEALLLAELQKQQQCSHFCDTLLKVEGVAVPAHSCVLAAVSPHISSTLSSTPSPPAGQSRLLEFRAISACALLHIVRLLYSGEMVGEGEKEKQEAISAAAKLGIHGLVEVTKREWKSKNEEQGGQRTDAGVQTEPLMPEESEVRWGRWRREVRDGSTILWKEILSDGQKDTCTQTEELEINTALPADPAASLRTIDVSALQSLGQTSSCLVPTQVPYVPVSLVYQPDDNATPHPSSDPAASMQDSTSHGHTSVAVVAQPYSSSPPSFYSFSNQLTPCAADAQTWWTGPPGADRDVIAGEECEDERLQQFQGDIPGFISYFLNPDKEDSSRRGQGGRRRRARGKGARRASTSERRARRPRGRTGGRGRGRGGLTQMVDVQDVGVSKLQKLFLKRCGGRTSMPGQGGGAVGRKLYLTTRELLKPAKSCQRRRRCGIQWEFSESGDVLPASQGGGRGGNKQCGGRNTEQQLIQDNTPAGRAWSARAQPTTPFSFSSPSVRFYNVHNLSDSSPSLHPSPCPSLLSPVATYMSPASSLLHTTSLPPPAPPPQEEQPEQIERLLEEVMMGLDILPSNHSSEPPDQNSSSSTTCASSHNDLTQNNQQSRTTDLVETCPGFHGSAQIGALAGSNGSSTDNSEVPILQQQEEGELTTILDRFLQSFEQHVDNCSARKKEELGGADPQKHVREISGKARASSRPQRKRRANQYMFSLEKKRKRSVPSTDQRPRILSDRDKQLQQMPVVRLERSGPFPVKVAPQGRCQSQDVKNPEKAKSSLSSVKYPRDSSSKNTHPTWGSRKMYPIRSRLKEAHMTNSFFEELTQQKPGCRRGRPKKNKQLPTLSNGESSALQIQPQFVETCGIEERLEKNQERDGEDFPVWQHEATERPPLRGKKRGTESEEETSVDATVVKKVCFKQTAQPTTADTCLPNSDSTDGVFEAAIVEMDDMIDVETLSLTSAGDGLRREEEDKNPLWSETIFRATKESVVDEGMESDSDEIIDVGGDSDVITDMDKDRDNCKNQAEKICSQSRTVPGLPHFVLPPSRLAEQVSLGSTGSSEDEDIDVIGGTSPLPVPVVVCWTEPSEGEEEEGDDDIDVVGEKTGCT